MSRNFVNWFLRTAVPAAVLAVVVFVGAGVFARYECTRAACLAAGWPRATLAWEGTQLVGYCLNAEEAVLVDTPEP
jgi:hypothetical protein